MNTTNPNWLFSVGAASEVLQELEATVGPLPPAYLELLRMGNGGEVGLCVDPLVLCLEPAETALDYWRSGTYTMDGVFVFGGNGGGDLIAFDLRISGAWPVVCFDPIDPEGSVHQIASSFEGLLALVKVEDA